MRKADEAAAIACWITVVETASTKQAHRPDAPNRLAIGIDVALIQSCDVV